MPCCSWCVTITLQHPVKLRCTQGTVETAGMVLLLPGVWPWCVDVFLRRSPQGTLDLSLCMNLSCDACATTAV